MYIGGTIHVLRASDRPFPPEFDRAYEASEILVFEADLTRMNSPETQQAIMAEAVYSDDRTLENVLSPEAYEKLNEYCAEKGLSLAQFIKFKPPMISLMVMGMEFQKLGIGQAGIDAFYHEKATNDQKAIESLETVEEQIKILTSMSDGHESAFIHFTLDELDKLEEGFNNLVTAWRAGDEEALTDLFITELKQDYPKLYNTLFVGRNTNWVPKIEKYLGTMETEFVLVGTGHLIGEEGVIAQIEKLGYKVEKFK
jgi:uncharacterized protein YbaP (TraB family)